jgi:hypothetical protein
MDAVLSGRPDTATLTKNNDKMLGWNAIDVACKVRPTEEDVAALGPEINLVLCSKLTVAIDHRLRAYWTPCLPT